MIEDRKYYLVVRAGKNSFLPVDWASTSFYKGENLYTLSGIDHFTSRILSLDLIKECVKLGFISPNDLFSSLEILYIENGKNYTIKEGPIFKEDNFIMGEDYLIDYIIRNKNNKVLINNLIMQSTIKYNSKRLEKFIWCLRNIDRFADDETLKMYLSIFKKLSYLQKRTICSRISNSIYHSLAKKGLNNEVTKQLGKVA